MTWLNRIEQIEELEDAEFDAALVAEMECEAACPKDISVENIARMNRQYLFASVIFRNDLD